MPVEEVAFAAHHDRLTQSELLSFAPVVFDTAHAGDEVARQIVQQLGDEVVSFAAALLRRIQLTDGDPDVVLGGRVLQAEDSFVMDRVRAGLADVAPNVRIRVLDVPPIAGALAAALELAGSTADQVATARGCLLGSDA